MKVKGGAHRQQNSNSKKAEMSRVLSGYGQVMDTIPERLLITAMGHPRKKMVGLHVYTVSTQKVEAGESGDQGQLWLHSEF